MFKYKNSRVLLFGREPLLGQVKTRLQAALGAQRVLLLYEALLKYQIDKITQWRLAPLEFWVEGDPGNPLLQEFSMQTDVFQQQGGDLGQRMTHAVRSALSRADNVILMGVDCPSIDREYLAEALRELAAGRQAVIGPAEDGGYVLLGLNHLWPELFARIEWGTARVLSQTLAAASNLGLDFRQLATRWDLDRPEDLARLTSLDPPLAF